MENIDMKTKPFVLLLCGLLSACSSGLRIGMGEKEWLRSLALQPGHPELALMEGDVTAYRYAGTFYYFKGGILAKISPTAIPSNRVIIEQTQTGAKAAQP